MALWVGGWWEGEKEVSRPRDKPARGYHEDKEIAGKRVCDESATLEAKFSRYEYPVLRTEPEARGENAEKRPKKGKTLELVRFGLVRSLYCF